MSILAILSGLLEVLSSFFKLKKESLVYDMLDRSEEKQDNLIKEIEAERLLKSEESAQKADFLFNRLQKEKSKYEKIITHL